MRPPQLELDPAERARIEREWQRLEQLCNVLLEQNRDPICSAIALAQTGSTLALQLPLAQRLTMLAALIEQAKRLRASLN